MFSIIRPAVVSLIILNAIAFCADTMPTPPYKAKVVGKDVSVYSSPSTTDSYVCGKVSSPEYVTVVRVQGLWSKIMPVEGCFSWISVEYVDVDKNMPSIGMVTGNSVRVWAGAEGLSPLRSKKSQTYLNEGELVTLMGPVQDEYYKIVPPVGAYLWIQNKNIKYSAEVETLSVRPSEFKPLIAPDPISESGSGSPSTPARFTPGGVAAPKPVEPVVPPVTPEPVSPVAEVADPVAGSNTMVTIEPVSPVEDGVVESNVAVTIEPSAEDIRLEECYAIKDLLNAESKKPVEKQNYDSIVKQLKDIIADPDAGRAIEYAEYEMTIAERYMLAIKVNNQLKGQKDDLNNTLEQIKANYIARTAAVPDTSMYTITGTIKRSQIYTEDSSQQRFVISDDTGKIVCYAVADNSAAKSYALSLEGKKVGLDGSITQDQNSSVSIVRFYDITSLEE